VRILVTGCAGFIGSNITERLLNDGHDVTGIDNFDPYYDPAIKERNISGFREDPSFTFLKGSILDKHILGKVPKGISVVCHQAATAGVRYSLQNPLKYNDNPKGTLALLERFKDARFIYASSSSVYGELSRDSLPAREDFAPNPASPYAASKLMGEGWCDLYSRIHGTKTVILRYFTVYGPRQRPDEAINRFTNGILDGREIQIYGDGEQTRDFTYVDDVVSANVLAMEKGSGTLNIASGESVSVNRLVELIQQKLGIKASVRRIGKQAGDVSHTLADISRAKEELGYSPEFSIDRGVKAYCEWAKRNRV